MQISQTLRPSHIPPFPHPDEPIEPREEDLVEVDGDEADEVYSGPGGVDEGLFALQGADFNEELAARIILQDQFISSEEDVGYWPLGAEAVVADE